MNKILNRDEVLVITGMTNSGLSHSLSIKNFPKPIRLGGINVGWHECDVLLWLKSVQPETWNTK